MTLGNAPYMPTHIQINDHNLSVIQAISLKLWQVIDTMYIERSCSFFRIAIPELLRNSTITEMTLVLGMNGRKKGKIVFEFDVIKKRLMIVS